MSAKFKSASINLRKLFNDFYCHSHPEYISYMSIIQDVNANHDLVLTDDGNLIAMDSAGANTVTIPLDSTTNFRLGTQILVTQENTGITSIAGVAGVTLQSAGDKFILANQFTAVSLIKKAADTWQIVGDMV